MAYQGASNFDDDFGDFDYVCGVIAGNIQKIQNNAQTMQRYAAQLGTPSDSERLRADLRQLQNTTNELAKNANGMLKRLMHNTNAEPLGGGSAERHERLRADRLRNDLIVVLNNLQAAQRAAAHKEKASVVRAIHYNQADVSDPFADDGDVQREAGHLPAQQLEKDVDVQSLRDRQNAIKELESNIVDVNQIFKDLALMVHDQGQTIVKVVALVNADSIEANVEQADAHVTTAGTQLRQAQSHASAARKKKVCIVLFVAVVLLIVALVLWLSYS